MVANQKYTLLRDDFVQLSDGTKLYRIMALRDILTERVTVLSGQKGGYIESERNLSHLGDAWVFDGGIVRGSAFVCMDAIVRGKSEIWGEAYISGHAVVDGSLVCKNAIITGECNAMNCIITADQDLLGGGYFENCKFGDCDTAKGESVYDEVFAPAPEMQR